ncbi:hypothetical protein B0A48_05324 [Cryoendolithus antarcticus]|uniref:Uncharacterized protein n=1 Tax=Cryoendolithus antarcticus TaxID=1507870 RepID=A0A1V8TI63_9PEZI|nr:hypothetical protein B0A48_05324 [Cryoendolithus antarcticus]
MAYDRAAPGEWTPTPTNAPKMMHRNIVERDDRPASICGYEDGNMESVWDCGSMGICGFGNSAFGCCANTTVVALTTQLAQCEQISSCRDYSQGCDDACASDAGLWYCGNSTFPYCGAVIASGVYTNFDCFRSSQNGTPHTVLATWTDNTSPVQTFSSTSTSSSTAMLVTTSMFDQSSDTEPFSRSTIIQTPIPFTQSQQAESSTPSAPGSVATVTVTASKASTTGHSFLAILGAISVLLHAHLVADLV